MYLIKFAIATLWPVVPINPLDREPQPSVAIGGEREMSNEFRRPRRARPVSIPLNPNEARRSRSMPAVITNYGVYTRTKSGKPIPVVDVLNEYEDTDCDCADDEDDDGWYLGDDGWEKSTSKKS